MPYGWSEDDLCEFIRSLEKRSIICLVGAGISVSAGIPDFRSKGTGLYSQLASYRLPMPTSMFDIAYYCQRPRPFHSLSTSIFPSACYKPTLAHHFLALLDKKGLLRFVYTQNIDELELFAGVPSDLLLQCHGSYCKGLFCVGKRTGVCRYATEQQDIFRAAALDKATCHCPECGRVLKPHIVFFGEALPSEFQDAPYKIKDEQTQLVLIMGTSLMVAPFKFLAELVPPEAARVFVNREPSGYVANTLAYACHNGLVEQPDGRIIRSSDTSGDLRPILTPQHLLSDPEKINQVLGLFRDRDLFVFGDSDDAILRFSKKLGWDVELQEQKKECDRKMDAEYEREQAIQKTCKDRDGVKMALTPVFYTHNLAVPIAAAFPYTMEDLNDPEAGYGMLGFATESQLRLLREQGYLSEKQVLVSLTSIPSKVVTELQEAFARVSKNAFNFDKQRVVIQHANRGEENVYIPLNCHWASYCHSFVGAITTSESDAVEDPWDVATRLPGTVYSKTEDLEEDVGMGVPDEDVIYYRTTEALRRLTDSTDVDEESLLPTLSFPPGSKFFMQTEGIGLGLVQSSPLSRLLSGAPDAGEVSIIGMKHSNPITFELQTIVKVYEDARETCLERLQTRCTPEAIGSLAKPHTIHEVLFSLDEVDLTKLDCTVRYQHASKETSPMARDLVAQALNTILRRALGGDLKLIIVVSE
ncbi:Sir2 family protein [Giardia muris]|uniref:Sir2 family protein n=1 Tax=Giardia muris TaxID=5742 RepID=A0A4Z1SSZ2_GIAMU|nr:Sir2 family protein [Giardia muris]|eukprot:TNJ29046.1 Sir2 family protein [Giardia muris]